MMSNYCHGISNYWSIKCLFNHFSVQTINKDIKGLCYWSFMRRIHWWPVDSHHKGPVTWKMFPFDDFIMNTAYQWLSTEYSSIFSALGMELLQSCAKPSHYSDIIMSTVASQITTLSIVCSTICSRAHQRNHQSSTSLALVRGHRWIPSQRASNTESVSIWWCHHEYNLIKTPRIVSNISCTCKWDGVHLKSVSVNEWMKIKRLKQIWSMILQNIFGEIKKISINIVHISRSSVEATNHHM